MKGKSGGTGGEIGALQARTVPTRRACVPAVERILYRPFPVLDHGFVRVVDYMGSDSAVVQAARVSYGRGTKKLSDDRGLIRYLMRHWHTTPFEMCEMKFHVKLPVFVARQWIRHRMASVNEISARYSVLDREFYVPAESAMGMQSASNRQGRGSMLPPGRAREIISILREDALRCYRHYEEFLAADSGGTEGGLARELARINLPVGIYTQWYWKTDLHNLLNFLRLRMDPHAQHEIRLYAEVIGGIVEKWVPESWKAFLDYRSRSLTLSSAEAAIVRARLKGRRPSKADWNALSGRERAELREKLGIIP